MIINNIKSEIKKTIKKWGCPYVGFRFIGTEYPPGYNEIYSVDFAGKMLEEIYDIIDLEDDLFCEYAIQLNDDSIALFIPERFVFVPEKNLVPMNINGVREKVCYMFRDEPGTVHFTLKSMNLIRYSENKICDVDTCLTEVLERLEQYKPKNEVFPVEVNVDKGYVRIVGLGMGGEYILRKNTEKNGDGNLPIDEYPNT